MPPIPRIKQQPNVLVVCHGNICRSPLAAAVIRKSIPTVIDRGLKVRGRTRGPIAAKKIREFAARQGYDLSDHRGVQCTQEDVDWADVILYMDRNNLHRLQDMFMVNCPKVCLASYIGKVKIPDPNYIPAGPILESMLGGLVVAASRAAVSLKESS